MGQKPSHVEGLVNHWIKPISDEEKNERFNMLCKFDQREMFRKELKKLGVYTNAHGLCFEHFKGELASHDYKKVKTIQELDVLKLDASNPSSKCYQSESWEFKSFESQIWSQSEASFRYIKMKPNIESHIYGWAQYFLDGDTGITPTLRLPKKLFECEKNQHEKMGICELCLTETSKNDNNVINPEKNKAITHIVKVTNNKPEKVLKACQQCLLSNYVVAVSYLWSNHQKPQEPEKFSPNVEEKIDVLRYLPDGYYWVDWVAKMESYCQCQIINEGEVFRSCSSRILLIPETDLQHANTDKQEEAARQAAKIISNLKNEIPKIFLDQNTLWKNVANWNENQVETKDVFFSSKFDEFTDSQRKAFSELHSLYLYPNNKYNRLWLLAEDMYRSIDRVLVFSSTEKGLRRELSQQEIWSYFPGRQALEAAITIAQLPRALVWLAVYNGKDVHCTYASDARIALCSGLLSDSNALSSGEGGHHRVAGVLVDNNVCRWLSSINLVAENLRKGDDTTEVILLATKNNNNDDGVEYITPTNGHPAQIAREWVYGLLRQDRWKLVKLPNGTTKSEEFPFPISVQKAQAIMYGAVLSQHTHWVSVN